MQKDFHYYATYCAAYMAGYSHEDSLVICYSAQFVDWCSRTLLEKIKGPVSAATTQLQLELMDARTDMVGLQDITRIWSSFHFLPYDLKAKKRKAAKPYLDKYRLICNPNGDLLVDTVNLARDNSLQAVGIAMHVLADTWAHRYFAGTPSLVINNTNYNVYEQVEEGDSCSWRHVAFRPNPTLVDDIENGIYVNSLFQFEENSIMNLGHGRAGHLPDYSFMRYRYLPSWGGFSEILKDNPSDYLHAFTQMIHAMKYLRGDLPAFEKECYDMEAIRPWEDEINAILRKRQLDSSQDWKAFGEKLSAREIPDFDLNQYQKEYMQADKGSKDSTFLGQFILGALAQKSMVTARIFRSGNLLAGFSVDYSQKGFRGMRDYKKLVDQRRKQIKRNENQQIK